MTRATTQPQHDCALRHGLNPGERKLAIAQLTALAGTAPTPYPTTLTPRRFRVRGDARTLALAARFWRFDSTPERAPAHDPEAAVDEALVHCALGAQSGTVLDILGESPSLAVQALRAGAHVAIRPRTENARARTVALLQALRVPSRAREQAAERLSAAARAQADNPHRLASAHPRVRSPLALALKVASRLIDREPERRLAAAWRVLAAAQTHADASSPTRMRDAAIPTPATQWLRRFADAVDLQAARWDVLDDRQTDEAPVTVTILNDTSPPAYADAALLVVPAGGLCVPSDAAAREARILDVEAPPPHALRPSTAPAMHAVLAAYRDQVEAPPILAPSYGRNPSAHRRCAHAAAEALALLEALRAAAPHLRPGATLCAVLRANQLGHGRGAFSLNTRALLERLAGTSGYTVVDHTDLGAVSDLFTLGAARPGHERLIRLRRERATSATIGISPRPTTPHR